MSDLDDNPSTFRSYLELLRVPNIFTAVADVAMGALFVEADLETGGGLVIGLLIAASSLLYAAGVVLNDVFDVELDREERPERPLPSDRISLAAARRLGWSLLLFGVAAASGAAAVLHDARPAIVAAVLAACIVGYNVGLKRTPLGPFVMGGCRFLNVLLGMSAVAAAWQSEHWLVAAAIGTYIVGVTRFARTEALESSRVTLVTGAMMMVVGMLMLVALPQFSTRIIPLLQLEPQRWQLLIGLLGLLIIWRCIWALKDPTPERVQYAVRYAIVSIIVLDTAACYAVRGDPTTWPGIGVAWVVLALLAPALVVGKWIEST
jgi:4-hydroxybenzoate polyprenyltransferase